jgi:phosphoribosylformylglycinamidine cyclo-ligase
MEIRVLTRYRDAGVDIDSGDAAVRRIRGILHRAAGERAQAQIGRFAGLFPLGVPGKKHAYLAASADGVGTKLKVAFLANKHDTVGQDLVNHCVNDILCQGARPLFFLDYLAMGKLEPEVVGQIVHGLIRGCAGVGCALIGGETAEMPGFYRRGEYDLAGFIVGLVENPVRLRDIDGSRIRPGDVVLGLASSGLHTNGYSLARKIIFDHLHLSVSDYVPHLRANAGRELLKVHRCYFKSVYPMIRRGKIKGLAHITGGGLIDNIPRMLPEGCGVMVHKGSWRIPPVFTFLQENGQVEEREMFRVFNMGIGMALAVSPSDVDESSRILRRRGEKVFRIGEVVRGKRQVTIE